MGQVSGTPTFPEVLLGRVELGRQSREKNIEVEDDGRARARNCKKGCTQQWQALLGGEVMQGSHKDGSETEREGC